MSEKKQDFLKGSKPPSTGTGPRWPAILAVLAVGALNAFLPDPLSFGPYWLLFTVLVVMLIPTVAVQRAGNFRMSYAMGHVVLGTATASMIWSLGMLISRLPSHKDPPETLLRAAAALWATNILVFASWYWRLDAGGPHQRDQRTHHSEGAFLFPQMTIVSKPGRGWSPGFIDYLFLAFNTSTAFSPTDVPILSRWAKVMMMVQSVISLGTVALIAARAVNIL